MRSFADIDFTELTESFPAALCTVMIALTYSISDGMAAGIISYVVINLLCGKAKKTTVIMYILAIAFLLKYIFL
ncbi:MAG: hypothetical protein IJ583_01215 [Firmicutes bacterium]|nr:hypothetical protein [Bacillota bacterium]